MPHRSLLRRTHRTALAVTFFLSSCVGLAILLLELARRQQWWGFPWREHRPAFEILYVRAVILVIVAVMFWVTVAIGRKRVHSHRSRLSILGLSYSLAVVAAGLWMTFMTDETAAHWRPLLLAARALTLPAVAYVLLLFAEEYQEISKRLDREASLSDELYVYSTTDDLTSLPNRFLFNDRLSNALERSKRTRGGLAVLAINIDRFKLVNDSLGHAAGDQVLKEAAQRFTASLRKVDTVTRMGSDTFVAFMSDLSAPTRDATILAERLLEEMSRPIQISGHEVSLTVSVGVSISPNDGITVEELVMNADRAMARAKERGSNQFVFYRPELNQAAFHRLTVENELRKALQRDELVIYYQPKIGARTGTIVGAEALVRWRHPERGLLGPAEFIPVAEETRLIIPVDRWVLRNACLQAKAWQKSGLEDFRVSVNISARHFQAEDLVDTIQSELQLSQLPAKLLELEITESAMMANLEAAAKVLERIKALGVAISLDDFGTGHSSLAYLKRFPVDCLKIDRSLISDGEDTRDAALARAIVSLGHGFGLEVVAEGVETERQRDFLRGAGCDGMQGFLFSRPVPVRDFDHLLNQPGMKADPAVTLGGTAVKQEPS
jgi:diguanylate cyclase (GGDEF)-like protein